MFARIKYAWHVLRGRPIMYRVHISGQLPIPRIQTNKHGDLIPQLIVECQSGVDRPFPIAPEDVGDRDDLYAVYGVGGLLGYREQP